MTQKIITLSQELASQIAAGEVVERPVSVVKELIENSIDAWADSIQVSIKNGGIDMIEVRDNGQWIHPIDLPKALEKYSTSKIQNLKDLQEVMTFGFRGEAIASIASVSQFALSSKTYSEQSGKKIMVNNGQQLPVQDIAMNEGTVVSVENLFYNTPARLNYLKKPRTEYLKIQELIQRVALAYPEVELSLNHDEKKSLHFPKWQTLRDRVYEIYGENMVDNLLEIQHEFAWITIHGVISWPQISFSNKSRQAIFVNKRNVISPLIQKAASDAYNRFIAHGTFPWYVFFIELDPTQVDVNVHPRKMELRFAEESTVFRSVYHAVKNTLERVSLSEKPSSDSFSQGEEKANETGVYAPSQERASWETAQYYSGSGTKFKNYSPYTPRESNPAQVSLGFSQSITTKSTNPSNLGDLHITPLWKIIGQMHNSYIVVETDMWCIILDQHAIAERVIYEKLSRNSYVPKIQQILWWVTKKLNNSEQETYEQYKDIFEEMGFQIEQLSHGIISIHGIPDYVQKQNIEKIFMWILCDIGELGSQKLDEVRHKIWAYVACRSAVKFGDPLSLFEMHALLRDASLDYSATCPHGRPVVYEIWLDALQKKYER